MKKLVLIAAVAFGASMVSCGNKEKAAEAEVAPEAVEAVEVVEAVVDSAACDSAACDTVVAAVAEVAE